MISDNRSSATPISRRRAVAAHPERFRIERTSRPVVVSSSFATIEAPKGKPRYRTRSKPKYAHYAEPYYYCGNALETLARFKEALSHYDDAVRLRPQNVVAVNDLAWLLATCPLDEVRDGQRALHLAERLAELKGPGRFTFLDTLAAAHAEAGQFDKAVRWQEQAVRLAPAPQQDELQERLELYRQGKPFRLAPTPQGAKQ